MNKKFEREVLRLLPDFRVANRGCFFEIPVQHVLAGFVWEKVSMGIRVYKWAFPLYEGSEFFHLGYADQLPRPNHLIHLKWSEDLVHPRPGQEQTVAEEFVRRITPHREEVSKLRDLSCFLSYQQARHSGNPRLRRGLALTLIMEGERDRASEQLALCLQNTDDPAFKKSIYYWLTAIHDGTAIQKLSINEEQLKAQFSLPVD
jgi:hypothetical protein